MKRPRFNPSGRFLCSVRPNARLLDASRDLIGGGPPDERPAPLPAVVQDRALENVIHLVPPGDCRNHRLRSSAGRSEKDGVDLLVNHCSCQPVPIALSPSGIERTLEDGSGHDTFLAAMEVVADLGGPEYLAGDSNLIVVLQHRSDTTTMVVPKGVLFGPRAEEAQW